MSQQTDEIQEQIFALNDIADRLGEIRQELRTLGINDSRLENYVIPSLTDLVRGEGYNKYNTSLYDLIESLETQTVDLDQFTAALADIGIKDGVVDYFNDFRDRSMSLAAYVKYVQTGEEE